MAWRVGMKCVCVEDRPNSVLGIPPSPGFTGWSGNMHGLTKGKIYTVRALGTDEFTGNPVLLLVEIVRPMNRFATREQGFRTDRFRPLVSRSTDTGFSILADIRDGKRRVADEPVDAETLREMERALADAGYMPADRYVERNRK